MLRDLIQPMRTDHLRGLDEARSVLGPNIVVNGAFDADISGWLNSSGAWSWDPTGKAKLTGDGSAQSLIQNVLTAGVWYDVSFDVSATGGSIGLFTNAGSTNIANGSSASVRATYQAVGNALEFKRIGGIVTGTVDNVVARRRG